jgi:hypothetical protein
MNVPRLAASLLVAVSGLHAGRLAPTTPHTVKICMEVGVSTPWVVAQGAGMASQMFADIGVRVQWQHYHCNTPPPGTLVVDLATEEPDQLFPDALAYSRLRGFEIEVFYNRIVNAVGPRLMPRLLAHVLVHEISHMLEGVNRHSAEGIMKARWDPDDFLEMSVKPLRFAPEDVELIQRGISQRSE